MMKFREVMDGNDLVKISAFDYETVRVLTKNGIIKKDVVTEEAWYYGVNSYHYEQGGNEEEFRTSEEYAELSCLNKLGRLYVENDIEYIDVTEEFKSKFIEDLKNEGLKDEYQETWYSIDEEDEPYASMSYEELEQYLVYGEAEHLYDGVNYYIDIKSLVEILDVVEFLKVDGEYYLVKDEFVKKLDINSLGAYDLMFDVRDYMFS
ncbi:MAG: hypothetical protein ACRCX8_14190 [Sarcina sp.]